MENLEINQSEGGKELKKTFGEVALEVLEWNKGNFEGDDFNSSNSEGKEALKKSFEGAKGVEDILDFLALRTDRNEIMQLRERLNILKGVKGTISALPTENRKPSSEVLRKMLTGGYNGEISTTEIARRGQAFALALYLYMHSTNDEKDESMDTLEQLIIGFDDKNVNFEQYDIKGLEVEPFLADMCSQAIEKLGLQGDMRKRFQRVFENTGTSRETVASKNARLVIPQRKTA